MKSVRILLAAALCAGVVHAETAPAGISAEKTAANVHTLFGRGGNIAVIEGAKEVYLVDTQYADLHDAVSGKINGVANGKPVRYVINTHWHKDHTDGNAAFKEKNATLIAHENAYAAMTRPQQNIGGETVPPPPAEFLPQLTFAGQFQLHDANGAVKLNHIPNAHTDSDIIVHLPQANVIHTGDIFFNGRFPYIDTRSGGSINGMIRGSEYALRLADSRTKIIPGHGKVTDRKGLEAYLNMLVTVRDRVRKLKAQGRTLAQIQAAKPAREWESTHNWAFINAEKFTESVYNSL